MVFRYEKLLPVCAALILAGCAGVAGNRYAGGANPIESQLLAEIALERGEYAVAVTHYLNVARQSDDPEFARRASELAYAYGFDAHALAAAERWVQLDGDSSVARTLLGILQVRFDQQEAAWRNLEIALGPPEDRTDQPYASLSGDLVESPRRGLTLFERFNEAYPDTAGLTRSLAELAVLSGDLDRGIAAARQTLSLRPDWTATRVWFARLLLLSGERSSAFEQMAFALEASPGVDMELEFVRLLVYADELEEAAARLERISDRYPEEDAVILTGAGLLMQAGRPDDAEALYLQLLATGGCLNDCYWHLGRIAMAREDYQGAIDLFRRIGAGEWLQPAALAMAQSYHAMGASQAALETLENFATNYPKRAFAMLQPKATLLLEQERYAEAAEVTATALDYRPWSEDLWLAHGSVLEQGGRMKPALEAFRTAWELAPDSSTTQNAYGYTLTVSTRRYAEAERLITRALEQDPTNPAIMDSKGWVLFKRGNREAARVWLEQAYALLNDPEIAAHLGELLWVSGEREAARAILLEAQQEFPENRSLQKVIQRLLN